MDAKVYKAQPLECFQKGKELKEDIFRELASAPQSGKKIGAGSPDTTFPMPLMAGLKDCLFFNGDVYAANVSADREFCTRALQAVENKGYARDMCGYFKNDCGSMFMDEYLYGGRYPRPDFCITVQNCDNKARWTQVVAEHFKVPYFVLDYPIGCTDMRKEDKVEFMATQYAAAIEWMEKVSGIEYDDEALLKGIENYAKTCQLWSETMLMNSAVPAPLDVGAIMGVMAPVMMKPHEDRTVEFYKTLRDEVQYRVDNQIGILATERYRLMLDEMPSWVSRKAFRHTEKEYGALWVGMWIYVAVAALLEHRDGKVFLGKTPDERGWSLKNRDDGVTALAELVVEKDYTKVWWPPDRAKDLIDFARHWRVDGVALHYSHTCPGPMSGKPLIKLDIQEAGIPVIAYEASSTDPREQNERDLIEQFDRFMDIIGARKLVAPV